MFGKKEVIILIYKILAEYTDENHYLTQADIIDKLYQLYGITVERKSVSNSLQSLQELDYDIVKKDRKGYALYSRLLEDNEIRYINDALFSSKSITGKQTINISNKLNSILSKYQRREYNYLYKSTSVNRTSNNEIFYDIELIQEAIKNNKKISFQYVTYDENGKEILRYNGYRYIISPYYLINNFGRYYLLGHYRDKYKPIQNYRLDYLRNIQIENKDAVPLNSLKGFENFDIATYINEHVYMFSEDVVTAKIQILETYAIQYLYDYFGSDIALYKENYKLYTNIKSSADALYFWILQYGEAIKVIKPDDLVVRLKEYHEKEVEKYK